MIAIAAAGWLLFYTAIYDMVDTGAVTILAFVEPIKLFVPMIVFLTCGWGYIRSRRAIDKQRLKLEKQRKESAHLMLIRVCGLQSDLIYQRVIIRPNTSTSSASTAVEIATINELRNAYTSFLREGGDGTLLPESTVFLLKRINMPRPF